MKLRALAHARTGDKGNTSVISLIAYRLEDFEYLKAQVSAERVKAHFGDLVHDQVMRYELPGLAALNFVLSKALAGGVTRSLALDAHGKALSMLLLEMEIPEP